MATAVWYGMEWNGNVYARSPFLYFAHYCRDDREFKGLPFWLFVALFVSMVGVISYFYPAICGPKSTAAAPLLPKRQRYCFYKYPHPVPGSMVGMYGRCGWKVDAATRCRSASGWVGERWASSKDGWIGLADQWSEQRVRYEQSWLVASEWEGE